MHTYTFIEQIQNRHTQRDEIYIFHNKKLEFIWTFPMLSRILFEETRGLRKNKEIRNEKIRR